MPNKNKYVGIVSYYPNCRTCDTGFSEKMLFFKSIKEILKWFLENYKDYSLDHIYTISTGHESKFEISYEYGRHLCTGSQFKYKDYYLQIRDDGYGNKKWFKGLI